MQQQRNIAIGRVDRPSSHLQPRLGMIHSANRTSNTVPVDQYAWCTQTHQPGGNQIKDSTLEYSKKNKKQNKSTTVPQSAWCRCLLPLLGGILSTVSLWKKKKETECMLKMRRPVQCRLHFIKCRGSSELTPEELLRCQSLRGPAGTTTSHTPEQRHSTGRSTAASS